jgi:hypothetical protein
MSLHQNKLLLIHDKRCFVSQWPPASEIGMLLITNFLELRMVSGISRALAGRPHAVTAGERHGMSESAFTNFLSGAPLWTETPTAPADGVAWAQVRAHGTFHTRAEKSK